MHLFLRNLSFWNFLYNWSFLSFFFRLRLRCSFFLLFWSFYLLFNLSRLSLCFNNRFRFLLNNRSFYYRLFFNYGFRFLFSYRFRLLFNSFFRFFLRFLKLIEINFVYNINLHFRFWCNFHNRCFYLHFSNRRFFNYLFYFFNLFRLHRNHLFFRALTFQTHFFRFLLDRNINLIFFLKKLHGFCGNFSIRIRFYFKTLFMQKLNNGMCTNVELSCKFTKPYCFACYHINSFSLLSF